jgi:apolipoprotein N-acyltransferase
VWFLGVAGLALFFWTLRSSALSNRQAAQYGLLFGTITGCGGTIWFLHTLPLDFLGIHSQTVQICAVTMTWLYVGASLGAPVAVAALLLRRFRNSKLYPLAAALIWTATETARMWSFAATTWAPNSLLGPHFSIASIGYTVTESHTLLQVAHPLGIDALNFFAALLAGLIAVSPITLKQKGARLATILQSTPLLILLALGHVNAIHARQDTPNTVRFALISENLTDVRDFSAHDVVQELLAQAATSKPPADVILLPEEFSLTSLFWSREEADAFIKRHVGDREVLILNSRNDLFPAEETNELPDAKKLVYDSTRTGEVARYNKLMLMPLGEYAPAFTKTFFSVINDPSLQSYINDVTTLPAAGSTVVSAKFNGLTLGGLLCSDLLSPTLYRSLAQDHKADVLINLANQFWFHGSRLLHWKTIQIAKMHAVQNRLPFLLANNVAPSFAISPQGDMIKESRWGKREVLHVDIESSGAR